MMETLYLIFALDFVLNKRMSACFSFKFRQHHIAMSWDSYIDNLIAQSRNQIDLAAIVGVGGGKWTTDNHPNVQQRHPPQSARTRTNVMVFLTGAEDQQRRVVNALLKPQQSDLLPAARHCHWWRQISVFAWRARRANIGQEERIGRHYSTSVQDGLVFHCAVRHCVLCNECVYVSAQRYACVARLFVSAVVIAHCKEGGQQGNVNNAVAIIIEYLKSQGM